MQIQKLLVSVLVLGAVLASAVPVAAFGQPVVLLSRGRTEPVVAVDSGRSHTVLVGANTNYNSPVNGTFPVAYFASHDGGRHFDAGSVPVLAPYTTGADPTVAIATSGTIFYLYLGETPAYCSGGRSAVLLSTSTNGGRSFGSPVVIDANPADDKPNFAMMSSPGKPSRLFVTWTRWYDHGSDIWYSRSLDGGRRFSPGVKLYGSSLDNFASTPVVGPHGHVHVFWSVFGERGLYAVTPTTIVERASVNGGASFGSVRSTVPSFSGIPRMAQPGSLRNLTAPAVAVNRQGALILAYASVRSNRGQGVVDANINVSRSLNDGRSWARPVAVNDAYRGDRFMPAVATLPDGSVGIAFYDRRSSPDNLGVVAVHVVWHHGVHRSRNIQVNHLAAPVNDIFYIRPGSTCFSPGRFFGDYIGAASMMCNRLAVTWADTGLHVPSETDVWFASVAMPEVSR